MTQLSLADALAAQSAGIARAESNDAKWIAKMREKARQLYFEYGRAITADDLRPFATIAYFGSPISSKAWGGIFSRKEWKCVGRKPSLWPGNNARWISEWCPR